MKIKRTTYIFILSFFLFLSCKDKNQISYPSGNIKTKYIYGPGKVLQRTLFFYDKGGNFVFKELFHQKDYDSSIYYYDNGKIFKTGKQNKDGYVFGKWDYYTREGFLSCTKEFFLINNALDSNNRLNQVWYYNREGDTVYYGNNRFNIYEQKEFAHESKGEKTSIFVRFFYTPATDTISISDPITCIAEDGFPMWEKQNSESYIVLAKEHFNFNADFSNEKQVKLDTFYCLERDRIKGKSLPKANQKHTVIFGRWFDTPGKKVLRGYMVESYSRKSTADNKVIGEKRRTYFEKIVYVKDTL